MRYFATAALLFALFISAAQFPQRVVGYALPILPIAQLWFDADAQRELAMQPAPFSVLRATNEFLPANARVLLVTDGGDVRRREYTTFHRALYWLTPRPVIWVSPAPHDGTWESKWWLTAPLTAASLHEIAAQFEIDYFLVLAPLPAGLNGDVIREWNEGALIKFQTRSTEKFFAAREFVGIEGIVGIGIAIFAILGVGGLALKAFTRGENKFSLLEQLAICFVFGTGLVSLALAFALIAGISLQSASWILIVPAAIGIVSICREVWRAKNFNPRRVRPRWEWLAISWLALQTFFVAWIAMAQPLTYWDSWVTWGMKARTIFLTQSLSPAVYADATRAVTHLDYPLLLPMTEAFVLQWLGAADDRWLGIVAVGYFLALVAIMYFGVARLTARTARAWLAALVIASLPGITLLAGMNGADVPFATFVLLGMFALVEWLERENKSALGIALLSFAFLPWLKREGWVFLGAVVLALVVLAPRNPRVWRAIGFGIVSAFLVAAPWYVFVAAHNVSNTDFLPFTLQTLWMNLERVPRIALYFAREMLHTRWSFVIPFALLMLFVRWRSRSSAPIFSTRALFLITPLCYVCVMASVYLFSAFVPFRAHLASSGFRLVAQVLPLLVVWLAIQESTREGHEIHVPA